MKTWNTYKIFWMIKTFPIARHITYHSICFPRTNSKLIFWVCQTSLQCYKMANSLCIRITDGMLTITSTYISFKNSLMLWEWEYSLSKVHLWAFNLMCLAFGRKSDNPYPSRFCVISRVMNTKKLAKNMKTRKLKKSRTDV